MSTWRLLSQDVHGVYISRWDMQRASRRHVVSSLWGKHHDFHTVADGVARRVSHGVAPSQPANSKHTKAQAAFSALNIVQGIIYGIVINLLEV